jgi:hypothetical protein
LGDIIATLEKVEREKAKEKSEEKAKEHFEQTLDKLWPLKSNEQQN